MAREQRGLLPHAYITLDSHLSENTLMLGFSFVLTTAHSICSCLSYKPVSPSTSIVGILLILTPDWLYLYLLLDS